MDFNTLSSSFPPSSFSSITSSGSSACLQVPDVVLRFHFFLSLAFASDCFIFLYFGRELWSTKNRITDLFPCWSLFTLLDDLLGVSDSPCWSSAKVSVEIPFSVGFSAATSSWSFLWWGWLRRWWRLRGWRRWRCEWSWRKIRKC